ncbi:MAG: DUF3592 domain-containing protein [Nitrospirota bacterium]
MAIRARIPLHVLGRHFWLVFGGLWLTVGLPFVFGGIHLFRIESRFGEDAVAVQGMVLTRDIHRARSNDGGTSTRYEVTYRFTADDGRTFEHRDSVNVQTWEALTERGPVEVRYLPDDPTQSRIAGETDWAGPLIMGGLGGVFAVAGGLIVAYDVRRRVVRARLQREGVSADAIVTSVEPTNFLVNRVPQWVIRYRYVDDRGRTHEGTSEYLSPEEAGEWKEDDVGRVHYDRQQPAQNVWSGRAGGQP